MNPRSLVAPSVLLQATLLVASGCAGQPESDVGPKVNQVPPVIHVECKVDAAHFGLPAIDALSGAALTTRNDLFARLCSSPGAELVDVTDPTLKGHVVEPKGFRHSRRLHWYPSKALQRDYQGDVLVAMVVEANGSLHDVTILESSGYDLLDMATREFFEEARFKTPAKLDRRPVRALVYQTIHWRIESPSLSPPVMRPP